MKTPIPSYYHTSKPKFSIKTCKFPTLYFFFIKRAKNLAACFIRFSMTNFNKLGWAFVTFL